MTETILFVAIVFGGLVFWFLMNRERPARFRRKPVLTGSGLEFFYQLRHALPECHVCPQVAVAALIEPAGVGRSRQTAVDGIDGKRVGYAVFDEDLQLVAVVELDHRSRPARKDAAIDAAFAAAGIRTIRFHTKRLPSEAKIRSKIFPRSRVSSAQHYADTERDYGADIEFKRPNMPWRNTINAHI